MMEPRKRVLSGQRRDSSHCSLIRYLTKRKAAGSLVEQDHSFKMTAIRLVFWFKQEETWDLCLLLTLAFNIISTQLEFGKVRSLGCEEYRFLPS